MQVVIIGENSLNSWSIDRFLIQPLLYFPEKKIHYLDYTILLLPHHQNKIQKSATYYLLTISSINNSQYSTIHVKQRWARAKTLAPIWFGAESHHFIKIHTGLKIKTVQIQGQWFKNWVRNIFIIHIWWKLKNMNIVILITQFLYCTL